MNGHFDPNKPDIFEFDEKRQAAFLEDVLVHNARKHVLHGARQAQCFESVVAAYAEFFKNKDEYRQAAREDFNACVDAHRDLHKEGWLDD